MVRGTFSPARAWRLAVGPTSTRTLGSVRQAMRRLNKVSACRRELNIHEAAKPLQQRCRLRRTWGQAPAKLSARPSIALAYQNASSRPVVGAPHNFKDKEPVCQVERAHCVGSTGVRSVRRAAAMSTCGSIRGQVPRRLEYVARHGCQRGAGRICGWSTRHWQVHHHPASGATLPNPSLKRSANGRPPGPGRRYVVHCQIGRAHV